MQLLLGSLFSELSMVEIKKESAAPRECVSSVLGGDQEGVRGFERFRFFRGVLPASAVRALSEHLPCKPWIPDLSPYLRNRQVSDWVQVSNPGVKTSHISDGFRFRILA
ncbi:hypothetical protein DPMN_029541 [Dreissena polymorpha]|uniref:Uncharacterized protein n=1 Tax=Dreissena polymorpha TaxID=45954 RepID=A0A9D4RH87_DREPO|nr:hypothetical protein DPMN_029541 [Dreissena polymorpha]